MKRSSRYTNKKHNMSYGFVSYNHIKNHIHKMSIRDRQWHYNSMLCWDKNRLTIDRMLIFK